MANADAHRGHELIAIVGPTGTGKTDLSLDIAESIRARGGRAEIVNADAMQLYRGMDIGTAKVPVAERRGIPHHMLDVLEVRDDASVAWYQPRARRIIDEIIGRGAMPILVGGSGLYVSSVIFDFAFPPRDPDVRARLERELNEHGPGVLHARLRERDAATADRVDPANGRRIVRALEVNELAASGHGGALPDEPAPWRPARVLGLRMPRLDLTARLDARVETMWRNGLLDEVARLIPAGLESGSTASRGIGYAQALDQLRGRLDEASAIAATQQLTRRYARRQVSWFQRYRHISWLDAGTQGVAQAAMRALDARP
ncbi:tRNA (adenosine(37)-N6)-dimethylallyltransferase MiaA [Microbacterium sp. STN6]|uniref:tRNA (adenosine(37)-N6)-dimethylallyltransferase MiaA n=1 Tax=Microbacterium sp. STN6 TaxID=2995588 RepID=UPI002260BB23|nr:tRNA (adenosine(37)-N6)-dimethylallyltransferase MiaA [Microbacterium sp. STN6]MCX7521309.1 tRNA (adenosine(37)-N6)-dimethylallyltransferase MiaA [Microbacterium sp. STN6]